MADEWNDAYKQRHLARLRDLVDATRPHLDRLRAARGGGNATSPPQRSKRSPPAIPDAAVNEITSEQEWLQLVEKEEAEQLAQASSETAQRELQDTTKAVSEWIAKIINQHADATTPQLGTATYKLTPKQREAAIASLRELAPALCDPRRRPRRPDATLPVQLLFEVDPAAKPTKDGHKRSMNIERQQAMSTQVDTLLQTQLVEICENPTWVHAVVLVRKPDGRWRFAIDYRPLNRALTPASYPLPDIDELVRFLATKKYFSRYDMTDAFYHISIPKNQRHFTAFHVPGRGDFQWTVMPMGIQPATACWQANMERIFGPLLGRGALAFADDLVIYGDDLDELNKNMRRAHALMRKYDIRISAKKLQLFAEEITFLGRRVRHGKIEVEQRHIDAIRNFPAPTNVVESQRFLGMVNFNRTFIRELGDHAAPLVAMQTKAAQEARQNGKPTASAPLEWTTTRARRLRNSSVGSAHRQSSSYPHRTNSTIVFASKSTQPLPRE